jgi:hypothetical protein
MTANYDAIGTYVGLMSDPELTQADFARFSAATTWTRPQTHAVYYAQRVLGPDRAYWERIIGRNFTQLGLDFRSFTRAPQAAEYAVTRFYEGLTSSYLGWDLRTYPVLNETLQWGMDNGYTAYSPPNVLGVRQIGAYIPIFNASITPNPLNASVQERRAGCQGWILGLFDIAKLFNSSLGRFDANAMIEVTAFDVTKDPEDPTKTKADPLMSNPVMYPLKSARNDSSIKRDHYPYAVGYTAFGRDYEIRCLDTSPLHRHCIVTALPWFLVVLLVFCFTGELIWPSTRTVVFLFSPGKLNPQERFVPHYLSALLCSRIYFTYVLTRVVAGREAL